MFWCTKIHIEHEKKERLWSQFISFRDFAKCKKKKTRQAPRLLRFFFGVDFLAHLSLEKKKKIARYFLSNWHRPLQSDQKQNVTR